MLPRIKRPSRFVDHVILFAMGKAAGISFTDYLP